MASTGSKMQYRFLGRSGLQVSVIALGGWYDAATANKLRDF